MQASAGSSSWRRPSRDGARSAGRQLPFKAMSAFLDLRIEGIVDVHEDGTGPQGSEVSFERGLLFNAYVDATVFQAARESAHRRRRVLEDVHGIGRHAQSGEKEPELHAIDITIEE